MYSLSNRIPCLGPSPLKLNGWATFKDTEWLSGTAWIVESSKGCDTKNDVDSLDSNFGNARQSFRIKHTAQFKCPSLASFDGYRSCREVECFVGSSLCINWHVFLARVNEEDSNLSWYDSSTPLTQSETIVCSETQESRLSAVSIGLYGVIFLSIFLKSREKDGISGLCCDLFPCFFSIWDHQQENDKSTCKVK